MPKTYTTEEIKKLLTGYQTVHPMNYNKLNKKTHVRYFKKDGKFVRGGFVLNYWSRNGVDFVHLGNNLNTSSQGYKAWPVALTNIKALYAKKQAEISDNVSIRSLNESISKQKNIVDSINKIIKKIAHHNKRLSDLEKTVNKLITITKNRK